MKKKLTELSNISIIDITNDDELLILDKTDLTDSPEGTHKKVTFDDLRHKLLNGFLVADFDNIYIQQSQTLDIEIYGGIFTENTNVEIGGVTINYIDFISVSKLKVNITTNSTSVGFLI